MGPQAVRLAHLGRLAAVFRRRVVPARSKLAGRHLPLGRWGQDAIALQGRRGSLCLRGDRRVFVIAVVRLHDRGLKHAVKDRIGGAHDLGLGVYLQRRAVAQRERASGRIRRGLERGPRIAIERGDLAPAGGVHLVNLLGGMLQLVGAQQHRGAMGPPRGLEAAPAVPHAQAPALASRAGGAMARVRGWKVGADGRV